MSSTSKVLLLAADASPSLLPLLRSEPELVRARDSSGYTLIHALASYNHFSLLSEIVRSFSLDINVRDEDGETALFVSETVEAARCLVEELGADWTLKNDEGDTAEGKIVKAQDFPEVAAWLRTHKLSKQEAQDVPASPAYTTSSGGSAAENVGLVGRPPPLPNGITMNLSTMDEEDQGGEADEEFRHRIEALASQEDFGSEESQRALRDLVTDAVRDAGSDDSNVRRRV